MKTDSHDHGDQILFFVTQSVKRAIVKINRFFLSSFLGYKLKRYHNKNQRWLTDIGARDWREVGTVLSAGEGCVVV